MKAFFTITFFICFSFCYCQKKKDIQFRVENEVSINEFLKSKNIEFTNDQIATLKNIQSFVSYIKSSKLGVPDAYFFNSKGELLETGSKGTDCSVAINRLDKIYKCKSDSHQLLQNFLDDIQIQDDKKFIADNVDIYVIITWAKFLSSESETSFSWFSHLKGEQKYSIKVLLLNLDVQESWNLSEKQKKYLGVI